MCFAPVAPAPPPKLRPGRRLGESGRMKGDKKTTLNRPLSDPFWSRTGSFSVPFWSHPRADNVKRPNRALPCISAHCRAPAPAGAIPAIRLKPQPVKEPATRHKPPTGRRLTRQPIPNPIAAEVVCRRKCRRILVKDGAKCREQGRCQVMDAARRGCATGSGPTPSFASSSRTMPAFVGGRKSSAPPPSLRGRKDVTGCLVYRAPRTSHAQSPILSTAMIPFVGVR